MYPKNENRNQRAQHPEFCPSFLNIYFQHKPETDSIFLQREDSGSPERDNLFDLVRRRVRRGWNFLLIICPLPLTRFPSDPRYTFYAVLICFFDGEYPIQRARGKNQGSTTTNNLARFSRMEEIPRPRRGTFCYREKRKRRFPGGKTAKKRFQKIFRPRFNGTLLLILLLKNNEIIQRLIVETESRVEP